MSYQTVVLVSTFGARLELSDSRFPLVSVASNTLQQLTSKGALFSGVAFAL